MSIERFSNEPSKGPEEEPKLIIDEDWKTQVQREKELFIQKQQASQNAAQSADDTVDLGTANSSTTDSSSSEAAEPTSRREAEAAPPASFEYLVSGMATQALAAMGQIPDEEGKPYPASLEYARHYIDLLGILENKTKGNLSDHEQRFLQDALHQLRMLFVAVKQEEAK